MEGSSYSPLNTPLGVKRDREEGEGDGVDKDGAAYADTGIWSDDSEFSSTSASTSASAPASDEDEVVNALEAHVKASVFALHRASHTPQGASKPSQFMLNAKAKSRASQAEDTMKRIKEELLKPLSSSTELVVVDAADETAEVMDRVVSKKIPPPAPEEAKKLRRLKYVDHDSIHYMEVEKNFYIPPADVRKMTPDQIKELVKELDGAKVTGKHAPPPMRTWDGTGLSDALLQVLEKEGFANPFAVQSLAVPVLMSGLDLVLTAKTGSGKTLAYVLPLVRHCAHQPRCTPGEGPIGLILVPTQELAVQVFSLLEKLCRVCRLKAVPSYGSSSLSDNIKAVKGGSDMMVATPGRLLDLLTVNNGSSLNLQRVSFLVIDEADRLFDSGFIEHVEAFLKNIRPDRQLAMVTATLPRELKKIMVSHMKQPIEISVGGRPTPASNVDQQFYFFDEETYDAAFLDEEDARNESPRLLKLLQILGEEAASGERLFLIFTQRKEEVDDLMAKLTTLGYDRRIATLYSGMDPIDRQFALEHFAPGNQFILIATGVAERGLDIPCLEMVINYSLPDHVEAYVHRIGRTGRAGKKGRAISFFRRVVDDDIAPELADALERAGQTVPEEMYEIAARVRELRREGGCAYNVGFYRGYRKGRHHRMGDRSQKQLMREAAKAAGLDEYLSDSESARTDSDAESEEEEVEITQVSGGATKSGTASNALVVHSGGKSGALRTGAATADDRVAKALDFAKRTTQVETGAESGEASSIRFQCEYPINDLPDIVRSALQKNSMLRDIADRTGTTLVKKGIFVDARYKNSHRLKDGDRPLYLLIIGKTSDSVQQARHLLQGVKNEAMSRVKQKSSAVGAVL